MTPPTLPPRQQLNLRLPPEDLARFRAEAERRRLPLATWLRMVAHEECDRRTEPGTAALRPPPRPAVGPRT